jgi:hypothetical protein
VTARAIRELIDHHCAELKCHGDLLRRIAKLDKRGALAARATAYKPPRHRRGTRRAGPGQLADYDQRRRQA